MSSHILDLHGYRHHEVDVAVENFIYLNQDEMPLTIICGNSEKMLSLVRLVLERSDAVLLKRATKPISMLLIMKN